MEDEVKYRRVLVKFSGEAIAGGKDFGFSEDAVRHIVQEVLEARDAGIEIAVLLGGGNIFRGAASGNFTIERTEADNIGTLGTCINAVLLRAALKANCDYDVRMMSAISMESIAEPFIRLRAVHHLEKGAIIVLAGGIGQPFLTTDYPAVQRALEVGADIVLMAKNGTDGVYSGDPKKDPDCVRFKSISCDEMLSRNLRVMDQSALVLARDQNIPITVFDFQEAHSIRRICSGEELGTYIARDAPVVVG